MQCVENFAARMTKSLLVWRCYNGFYIENELCLRDAIMAFTCINCIAQAYLGGKFSRSGSLIGVITRESNDIHEQKFRTSMGQKSFAHNQLYGTLSLMI